MTPNASSVRRFSRALVISACAALSTSAAAAAAAQEPGQPPDTTAVDTPGAAARADTSFADTVAFEPVVVTVTRAEEEALRAPAAISVVGEEDIQLGQRTLTLDESLARVPGVLAQNRNNFSIGERLAIRGFGARAAFGIRGVRLILDGIPQTLADGQSVSSNIDLSSAGRIEVLRGPSSSLYGNAAGGVVDIRTEAPPPEPTLSSRFTGGAFDLQKYEVAFAGRSALVGYVVNVNRTDYEGFRDHSRFESSLVNARVTVAPDERSEWAFIVNYNDTPTAESPGSLTKAQADSAPDQARQVNVDTRSGEEHQQLQGGVSYSRAIGENQGFFARAYALTRDVLNPLPFAFIDLERFAGGGGLQYTNEGSLFGRGNRVVVGADLDLQSDDRKNFDNDAGSPGAETLLDQDEQVTSLGFYVQNETEVASNLELTLGVRYDRVHFEVDDRLLDDGSDDSGSRTLDQGAVDLLGLGVSPLVGLRWSPTPRVNLYGNVATSFQTPTTTELANRPTGAGGFNPDLEPQRATSYELGVKGLLGERVTYDVAGYLIDIRDELIPFEVPDQPQRQFFRNAGSSQHNGVEASLRARLNDVFSAGLAYTYAHYFFDEFRTASDTLDGNRIPGVPDHRAFAQLGYLDGRGLFADVEAEYNDAYFVDDANTTKNDSYVVVGVRGGWTGDLGSWEVRPFVGVNNVFDEEYSGSVVVNAVGSRFFEPSPGRNAFAGLGLAYRF
jgi:iron complex outermembrane receptor protein